MAMMEDFAVARWLDEKPNVERCVGEHA